MTLVIDHDNCTFMMKMIFYVDDIALMEVRFRMLLVIMMMLTVTMMVFSPREIISKFIVFGFQGWMCSQANQGPSTTQVLPPGQFGLAELSGRNCWHVLLGKIFLPVHVYLTFLISLLSLRKSLTGAQTAIGVLQVSSNCRRCSIFYLQCSF